MKTIKNTIWLVTEKLISLGSALLGNIIIARTLQPEMFGVMNFLIATVTLFQPLMKFGMNSIITREICNNLSSRALVLKTTFIIRSVACLISFFIAVLAINFGEWFNLEYLNLFIFLIVAQMFSPFEIFKYWFEAEVNSKPVVLARTILSLFFILVKVYLVLVYKDLAILMICISVEAALGFIIYAYCYQKISRNITSVMTAKLDVKYLLSLVKQSSLLIFSAFAAVIYMKIDQVMLGSMSSNFNVAIYSVAVKFSEMAYFIPVAIVTSLFPGILNLKRSGNIDEYESRLKYIMGGLFWLAFIGAVFCVFVSEKLIGLTYGANYILSASVLNIHIWGGIFIFVRALLSKWILAEGVLWVSLKLQFSGALVNVILNYFWIPLYGPEGAAWATLVSVAFSTWVTLFFNRKTLGMALLMTKSPLFFLFKVTSLYSTKR